MFFADAENTFSPWRDIRLRVRLLKQGEGREQPCENYELGRGRRVASRRIARDRSGNEKSVPTEREMPLPRMIDINKAIHWNEANGLGTFTWEVLFLVGGVDATTASSGTASTDTSTAQCRLYCILHMYPVAGRCRDPVRHLVLLVALRAYK